MWMLKCLWKIRVDSREAALSSGGLVQYYGEFMEQCRFAQTARNT